MTDTGLLLFQYPMNEAQYILQAVLFGSPYRVIFNVLMMRKRLYTSVMRSIIPSYYEIVVYVKPIVAVRN